MAKVDTDDNPATLAGDLPAIGSREPDFLLTETDLSDTSLKDYAGKKVILNIFMSIDTLVCAASTRKFNGEAGKPAHVAILCISRDMPFAHGRFCGAEGLKNVIPLSSLRNDDFGKAYGVRLLDGALAGLFARAIVVLDESAKVLYTELVPHISQEPDYDAAIAAIRQNANFPPGYVN